ncbi:hypothetical protein MMPV_006987 [Pyropia vietnamensis]
MAPPAPLPSSVDGEPPPPVLLTGDAYTKLVLHAAKHPTHPVLGLLLGRPSGGSGGGSGGGSRGGGPGGGGGPRLVVTDALPLTYGTEGVTSAAVVEFGLLVAEALLAGADEGQGGEGGGGGRSGRSGGSGCNGSVGGDADGGKRHGRGRGRARGGADDGGLAGCTLAGIYYANALLGDDAPGPVVIRVASRVVAKYPHAVVVGVDGGRLSPAVRLSAHAARAYERRDGVWRRVGLGLDAASEVLAVVDVMLEGGGARRLVEWEDVCDEPSRDWLNRDLFVEDEEGGKGE